MNIIRTKYAQNEHLKLRVDCGNLIPIYIHMVNNKKTKWKAKGAEIQTRRTLLGLTQGELIERAKKVYQLKISLRNLQNAEASQEIGYDTLNAIAYFFDKESLHVAPAIKTSIDSIAINPDLETDKYKLEDTISGIKEVKSINVAAFASMIKKDRTFRTEQTFLSRVDNHDQVFQVIKKSKRRKIFYPFNPDQHEVKIIKKALTEISRIHNSLSASSTGFTEDEFDTDDYHQTESEIQSLTKITDFSSTIKELKKNNLNLYIGNFDFKYISSKPRDPWSLEEEEITGSPNYHLKGDYIPAIENDNYAIFSFHKSAATAITFNYDNEWYEEKIKKIIEVDPYSTNDVDYEAHSNIVEHYKFHYGYNAKFQKVKSNLTKTDLTELLTTEEIEKIGYEYELEKAEDQYTQMRIDEMRGK